jgi:hypothetical protein
MFSLPKAIIAAFNSFWSIEPELSLSNERKHLCQSSIYFHRLANSSKSMVDVLLRSNIPIISLIVSGLNGVHVPFERACWSSWALMCPLRSLSTLKPTQNKISFRIYLSHILEKVGYFWNNRYR